MLRRNQVTSSNPRPSEETTSKQGRGCQFPQVDDSRAEVFTHSRRPRQPTRCLHWEGWWAPQGTHATRDSRLLPQPGFPVVPLRDQLPIRSAQAKLQRNLFSPHLIISRPQTFHLRFCPEAGLGAPTLIRASLSLPDLLPLRLRSPLSSQSHVFEM